MNIEVKKIFVASPDDTQKERNKVNSIVENFNNTLGDTLCIKFEVVKWETHSVSEMGRSQEVINKQLNIENCDLFLGIIWKKFGTPTGSKDKKGNKFQSGTEEEFTIAYESWKTNKKPYPMVYRSIKSTNLNNVDTNQLSKVNKFFNDFSYDKIHPGLYKTYKTLSEFEKLLNANLIKFATDNYLYRKTNDDLLTKKILKEFGYKKIFVPKMNDERNDSKTSSLDSSEEVRLIAHSGHSFLGKITNNFKTVVEDNLKKGYKFKAILTNPWSETGFFISYTDIEPENVEMFTYKEGDEKYIDCVKVVENAEWYNVKYKDSINGYKLLKRKYGEKIDIRFTDFEMPSSILLTDSECYIEPYLPINLQERYDKGMLTFELLVSNQSELYKHYENYFEFLWSMSEDYNTFMKTQKTKKENLSKKLHLKIGE